MFSTETGKKSVQIFISTVPVKQECFVIFSGEPAAVRAPSLHLHEDEAGHHGEAAGVQGQGRAAASGQRQQLPQSLREETRECQVLQDTYFLIMFISQL